MQRHELLRHHRVASDCSFTLSLSFGAGRDRDELSFTEFYEYPSRPGDAGREYSYSIYVAERDLDRMALAWARRCHRSTHGDPRATVLVSFQSLIRTGELGQHLAIEENVRRVRSWLVQAGIHCRDDRWSWWNTD